MTKQFALIAFAFLAAGCGSHDSTAPITSQSSDISTMQVGEVRLLNPADIPNGITLPASSSARDYLIVVGNTNSVHDVVANYVVKADRSPTGVFGPRPRRAPSDWRRRDASLAGRIGSIPRRDRSAQVRLG